jgi:HD-GYP domain-containing protein (c-di-GMP phosphodiesterase class II)
LVRALQAHDPGTAQHSLRVRSYALRLAHALELDCRQLHQLTMAARLHDVGKVGIPSAVLLKPGSLTPSEYSLVQTHPVVGERLLSPFIADPVILAIIRHHHEHFDGAGYPDGLAGHEIPFLARLIAIADCFDALTSVRPYRDALPRQAALDHLRSEAGKQFDSYLVETFEGVVESWCRPCTSMAAAGHFPLVACQS